MTAKIVGLFRGTEQHRNVLHVALWTQDEGAGKKTIYCTSSSRRNRGNVYTWTGPETISTGQSINGFATGKPNTIVIGQTDFDSATLNERAEKLHRAGVLEPHTYVVALLKELETCKSYRDSVNKLWSCIVQEWWDTQDMVIPTRHELERESSPYGTMLTEKNDSSHHIVDECPVTDGVIKVMEQKERYDPRSPLGIDPVKDGMFRCTSQQPSPRQSPTQTSHSHQPSLTRATTMPVLTRRPPPIQTKFAQSTSPATRQAYRSEEHHSHESQTQHTPDPRLRSFETRHQSISAQKHVHRSSPEGFRPPPAVRPPRSKTDRGRSESNTERKLQQVKVVKTMLKVLAATAMTVV